MDNAGTTSNTETKRDTVIQTKGNHGHALRLPFLVTLAAAFIVVASFFLPLATANEEHAEYLQKYAEKFSVPEIEMTNEDVIHISMYEYFRMYGVIYSTVNQTLGTVLMVIIGAAGILSLVTVLFVLFKKPIVVFIFNALTLGAYYLMVWDFKDRGVMPNNNYDWGIAYYLYYIGIAAVFAGAVWLLIAKVKQKRKTKAEEKK